jgi:arylsulfatase A-like enzyme
MYQCQSRNPLIIREPEGVGAGKRIDALCYNYDITPTLLELVGLPIPAEMQAKSLAPLLRGETDSFRPCVTSGYNNWCMYRDRAYLMFQQFNGEGTVLIDLNADPREERNTADGNEDLVRDLRQRLEAECGGLPANPGWSWPPSELYAAKFPRVF